MDIVLVLSQTLLDAKNKENFDRRATYVYRKINGYV